MIKQIIALIVGSIVIVLTMSYDHSALQFLLTTHDWIANVLTEVFSGGQIGNMMRSLFALLFVPVLVGAVPALIYWLLRRHWFPYFMEVVWAVWLVQIGALVMMYQSMS